MKIVKYRMATTSIDASIKTGLFKTENITIPTKKFMYAFSDPQRWDEIEKTTITKEVLDEFNEVINDMLLNDNKTLAELLLKVAGKHHNSYENEVFRQLLKGK